MIIVKLMGGLGNQMFQYAAAKALALKHNVEVKVDITFLNLPSHQNYTQRKFELNIFEVEIKIANEEELKKYSNHKDNIILRNLQRNFPKLFSQVYATESGNKYQSEFKNFPKNTYLDGYWQSEYYFEKYKSEIKKAFLFKNKLPQRLESYFKTIKTTNSVSIHVRRGDYINLKSANSFHGVCSLEYYKSAINYIKKENNSMELFIFSDDLNWCKQSFDLQFPIHFIEHEFESYWDLYLMSNCKHNIIANSSFSWWAAWLNINFNKTIIAPKNWFVDSKIHTNDLILKNWIKL